jgi:hypothetical protein
VKRQELAESDRGLVWWSVAATQRRPAHYYEIYHGDNQFLGDLAVTCRGKPESSDALFYRQRQSTAHASAYARLLRPVRAASLPQPLWLPEGRHDFPSHPSGSGSSAYQAQAGSYSAIRFTISQYYLRVVIHTSILSWDSPCLSREARQSPILFFHYARV